MSQAPDRLGMAEEPDWGGREIAFAALQLFVLSAFAFAQPLLDVLGQNPEFFVAHRSAGLEIVLLAVALTLAPPAILFLPEVLLRLVNPRLGRAFHLLLVAVLLSLIAIQALKEVAPAHEPLALAFESFLAGAAGAVAVSRFRAVRTLLVALAPAPLVFVGVFLFGSPVERLVLAPDPVIRAGGPAEAHTPVVLIVFDELPVTSLLDDRRRIDGRLFPNFARLAARSIWFRNSTSVSGETTDAVPAILTGKFPSKGSIPVFSDHPDNLFTLLGRTYSLEVFESITSLCPPDLCARRAEPIVERAELQVTDLSLLYLHVLLPRGVATRLPSVSDAWADFRGVAQAGPDPEPARAPGRPRRLPVAARVGQVAAFIRSLRPGRPTVHFLHVLLPHRPWTYLPSGRDYGNTDFRVPGQTEGGPWGTDAVLLAQAYGRYLLQLGFVDRLLGRILRRLEESALYDESLVVVTADHGLSFRPGEGARGIQPSNIHEIASVPLFVKLPGQRLGKTVDRAVQTIDVLPTIADVLEVPVAWSIDGRSTLDEGLDRRHLRFSGGLEVSSRALQRRRDAASARASRVFGPGAGSFWPLRVGPHSQLVGQRVGERTDPAGEISASFEHPGRYDKVDLDSPFLPAYVTGRLDGAHARLDLAVAVNGRIGAVTRSFEHRGGTRFAAMVPESFFVDGSNLVELFEVVAEAGGLRLAFLGRTA